MPPILAKFLVGFFAITLFFAAGWFTGWQHRGASDAAAQAEAEESAREDVRRDNNARTLHAVEADRVQQTKLARQTAAADRARDELERLRDEIGRGDLPGSAACPGIAAYAATASRLVGECADRYLGVAREAAGSSGRLATLQSLVGAPAGAASEPAGAVKETP